ncbi:hypothetical protein HQ563_00080 [bacterium]|nr:hypothetical protein [bacterium]
MNTEQKRFYRFWLSEWRSGNPIPLDGQVSYAFCYLYSVLQLPPRKAAGVLERMYSAYPDEGVLTLHVRLWLSDCYVMEGEYVDGLEVLPEPDVDGRSGYMTDKRLTLKLLTGNRISGREALVMAGPEVNTSGRRTLQQISEYLDIQLEALESEERVNLLEVWARDACRTRYEIFTGYLGATEIDLPFYHFTTHEKAVQEVYSLMREAESTVREEQNSPKVGEAWVAETHLWYKLRKFFSDEAVIHHARPDWLGGQHLDILLAKHGVAIECRAIQKDQIGGFLNGEAALSQIRQGDSDKTRLCEDHGIRVLEVNPGYNLDCVIGEIIRSNRTTKP